MIGAKFGPCDPARDVVEPAMILAVDLITFELRQRSKEWARYGREDMAKAFERIESVVGGMTRCSF